MDLFLFLIKLNFANQISYTRGEQFLENSYKY